MKKLFGVLIAIVLGTGIFYYAPVYAVSPKTQAKNPINWPTEHAFMQADHFVIDANGQTFYGIPDPGTEVSLHSDPPDEPSADYTTLEAIWTERGIEMRLNLYFYKNNRAWWASEMRTYNGEIPGDWIMYTNPQDRYFITPLGQTHMRDSLTAFSDEGTGDRGRVHWENLRLQAFTSP